MANSTTDQGLSDHIEHLVEISSEVTLDSYLTPAIKMKDGCVLEMTGRRNFRRTAYGMIDTRKSCTVSNLNAK